MEKKGLAIALVGLVLTLALPTLVLAVPPLPCSIYGNVTLNGENVPEGTMISAWIDDVKYDEKPSWMYQNQSGYGILSVPGDDTETPGIKEGGVAGDIITFKIGEVVADQEATWQAGADIELDLTASTTIPTPSPTATATETSGPSLTHTPTPTLTDTPETPSGATATATLTPTDTPTFTPSPTWTPATPTATPQPVSTVLTAVKDTWLDGINFQKENYAQEGYVQLASSADGTGQRPLLKFDLSGIPVGSRVTEATLELYTNASWQDYSAHTVSVYKLKREWIEDEATWIQASSTVNWAGPGADDINVDRGSTAYDSELVDNPNAALYRWDITDLANEWAGDPGSNYGMILLGSSATPVRHRFSSSTWVITEQRPRLSLTYLPSGADPTPTMPATTPGVTATPRPTAIATAGSKTMNPIKDASLNLYADETNYGETWELSVKVASKRSVLQFDLGEIPQNAEVTQARLWLYAFERYGITGPVNVNIHALKRPWVEDEVTWKRASNDQPWGQPGADDLLDDRTDTSFGRMTVDEVNKWYSANVVSSVQDWVDGSRPNFGWILIASDRAAEIRFRSVDNLIDEGLYPRLEITFDVPEPTSTPTSTPTASNTPTVTSTPTPRDTSTPTPSATPSTGSIVGIVFEDQNENQRQDEGEPPLAGALIELYAPDDRQVGQYRTEADGVFQFSGLEPQDGYYRVVEQEIPPGYTLITRKEFSVRVAVNATITLSYGHRLLYTRTATPSMTQTATPTVTATPEGSVTVVSPTATGTPTLTPTGTPVSYDEMTYLPYVKSAPR